MGADGLRETGVRGIEGGSWAKRAIVLLSLARSKKELNQ